MNSYLPRIEILVYSLVYLIVLIYGIHQVFLIGDVISVRGIYSGFTKGWSILDRKRDDLDYEWETWRAFFQKHYIWFVIHILFSENCRFITPKHIPWVHAAVGFAFLCTNYHYVFVLLILFKNLSFFVAMKSRRNSVVWLLALVWVFIVNAWKTEWVQERTMEYLKISEVQCYEVIIILSWNILKILSFTLDFIKDDSRNPDRFDVLKLFGYVFYFPNMLLGPIIVYDRYAKMLIKNRYQTTSDFLNRFQTLILNVLRIGFWLLFTDFALHFLYINNLQYNPKIIQELNPWALYAFGFMMGQFFFHKYFVSYGLGIVIARFDRIPAPNLPKCIGRIHLYSDMWKYFDQGLYEFLFRYIYTDICSRSSPAWLKFLASLATFGFIYLWHGFYKFVLVWAILNFVCLQLEKVGKNFARSVNYSRLTEGWTEQGRNRLNAFFGSQLFIPAAMSNFFFIGGMEVGVIFMERTYLTDGIINYVILSACCYCIYHTAEFLTRLQRHCEKLDDEKDL